VTPRRPGFVVGDVHGELDGLREILRHAGLIDERDSWAGGGSLLIQTGDVIDRGPRSRESVRLLRELQLQAPLTGGQVVRLCGNHELMLLQGSYHYANFPDPERLAREIGEEILAGTIVASFSDGSRLYTHAGLRSEIRQAVEGEAGSAPAGVRSRRGRLERLSGRLNEIFRSSLREGDLESHPIFHVDRGRGGRYDIGGIFWGDYGRICASAAAYDIPQVFGHTPTGTCGVAHSRSLRLIDVDAGMCPVYGGNRVYLQIGPGGGIVQHARGASGWGRTVLE
jgi:hypothetical protein